MGFDTNSRVAFDEVVWLFLFDLYPFLLIEKDKIITPIVNAKQEKWEKRLYIAAMLFAANLFPTDFEYNHKRWEDVPC